MHKAGAPDPTEQMYAEIRRAYDLFNSELFGDELPHCLITLQREKQTYGYFSSQRFGSLEGRVTDEIALNPEFFTVVPQLEVLQTLVHEMAHVWQAHHGTPGRGRYHNREWADKMEAIGLMPSSTGQPGGRRVGDHMADYMIDDGKFAAVAKHLLGDGLRITWFDRFAPRQPLYTSTTAHSIAELPPQAAVVPSQHGQCQAIVVPSAHVGVSGAVSNKSLRVKYTCPACTINVWGKPGLRIGCVDCSLELQPV